LVRSANLGFVNFDEARERRAARRDHGALGFDLERIGTAGSSNSAPS
jgi:hypothetical protein